MALIRELIPDRNLIDTDFEGYKLSLDPLPIYDKNLENSVFVAKVGDNQFSYAHARVFSLHNHLLVNPFTPELMYYVDDDWNIVQVTIGLMNRVDSVTTVCTIPKTRNSEPGDFPVTVEFAAAQRAVVFDGMGAYHVAVAKKDKWVIVYTDSLSEKSLILSAKQIDDKMCILSRSISEPKFTTFLNFFILDDKWQMEVNKKIQISGNLLYACITSNESAIVIIDGGQKLPIFLNDEKEIAEEVKPKYEWTQTAEDFLIVINATEKDVKVEINDQKIKVLIKNEEIINGEFVHQVSNVKWTISDKKLEISGKKVEIGLGWQQPIKDDYNGKQFQALNEQDEETTFNMEELEEVDEMHPSALLRLNLEKVTHKVDLSTQPFIFSMLLKADSKPAVCVRNLTDACVWTFDEINEWKIKHIGTFSAFGYVQASKTQRKFITAPENMNYIVISDAYRHLYLFRQPSPVQGDLRNRTTGNRVKALAKQHLINLDNNDEILGIYATQFCVYLLTRRKFHVLVVDSN